MSKTYDTLKSFLEAEKPEWAIPADILVMAQLILIEGQEVMREDIAKRCGLKDTRRVDHAIKSLTIAGWIIKGRDKTFTVVADKLPKPKEIVTKKGGTA
jgi:hypothetical protein